jgi:hypothetical protein
LSTTYNLSPIFNALTTFGGNTSASAPNLPLQAGLLYTYAAGTTTPLAAYQTSTGTAWTNPIVLGLDGRVSGEIWLLAGSAYKFVLQDSQGAVIRTYDNIIGVNDTTSSAVVSEWIASGATPTYSSATVFTTPGNTTSTFQVGRRVQATVTAGTVYGTITASSYGVATTVTLLMDTGQALDSGLFAVNVGFLNATHPSVPAVIPYPLSLSAELSNTGQPSFFAWRTGTQTSGTTVVFNTISSQQGGSNFNVGTGVFTAPNTGTYFLGSSVGFVNVGSATINNAQIFVNGVAISSSGGAIPASGGGGLGVNLSVVAPMTAGQTASIVVTTALSASCYVGSALTSSFFGAQLF